MSSEYSSAGEDDEPLSATERRRTHWIDMLRSQTSEARPGKGGWAEGQAEKVLEVRTPTWRSSRLDDLYRRLDSISAQQAALRATPAAQQAASSPGSKANLRLGHVAPSHKRFTLPPHLQRTGHLPRDTGEPWMWASGEVGVWPDPQQQGHVQGIQQTQGNVFPGSVQDVDEAGMGDASVDALVEGWTEVS